MSAVVPRHVLCVLGEWKDLDRVEAIVSRFGPGRYKLDREFSQLEPDPRMESAFTASHDLVVPSIGDDDWAAIARHSSVAYVLSPPLPADRAPALSAETLAMIMMLFQAGALAVKGESAGIAHGRARWLELAAQAVSEDLLTRASALRSAWVRRPLLDGELLYSCGMHLLGERDVEIAASVGAAAAIDWIDALELYLLAEKPARGIQEGEGFRQVEGGERREMRFAECARYAEDDFFYNPYGYVRI